MMRRRRGLRTAAFVVGISVVFSACGGSNKDNAAPPKTGETTAPDTSNSAATTSKFKIMVAGDFTSSIGFTVPESVPAVKAALAKTPGAEVVSCDTKGDPNAALACERDAVAQGVVAVVTTFSQIPTDQSILDKAGIPTIGNVDTKLATSFAMASPNALYAAVGVGLAKAGCKKLGILYLDGTDSLVNFVKGGMESQGGKEVARAPIAANAPDLTASMAKLTGAKADCIALSVIPSQVVQAVTAVRQSGQTLLMAGVAPIFSDEVLKNLGAAADGILITDSQANPKDKSAGIVTMTKAIKAVDPKAALTSQGALGYGCGRIVAAAVAKVQGDVTAASLLAAMNGLQNVSTDGVVAPFSATELSKPDFKRLFNHFGISYEITKGTPTRKGTFYDLGPILENT